MALQCLEEILAHPSTRFTGKEIFLCSALNKNYQKYGPDSIKKPNESAKVEILNFEHLKDYKDHELYVNKQLPNNHEVIRKVPILIELNIDELRESVSQVLNALSGFQRCLVAHSIHEVSC